MAKLLFIKYGAHENPITKSSNKNIDEIKNIIGKCKTRFIGKELTPIGESTRMSDFSSPDCIALELTEPESNELKTKNGLGFYLVENLKPSEVK